MTLRPTPGTPVPEETARIAHAAVPKGNVYVQMRDVLGITPRTPEQGIRDSL